MQRIRHCGHTNCVVRWRVVGHAARVMICASSLSTRNTRDRRPSCCWPWAPMMKSTDADDEDKKSAYRTLNPQSPSGVGVYEEVLQAVGKRGRQTRWPGRVDEAHL